MWYLQITDLPLLLPSLCSSRTSRTWGGGANSRKYKAAKAAQTLLSWCKNLQERCTPELWHETPSANVCHLPILKACQSWTVWKQNRFHSVRKLDKVICASSYRIKNPFSEDHMKIKLRSDQVVSACSLTLGCSWDQNPPCAAVTAFPLWD